MTWQELGQLIALMNEDQLAMDVLVQVSDLANGLMDEQFNVSHLETHPISTLLIPVLIVPESPPV